MDDAQELTIVRRFFEAAQRGNVDEMTRCFTEDGVWVNVPVAHRAVSGTAALAEAFTTFYERCHDVRFDLQHISGQDGVVLTERVDHFKDTAYGGCPVSIPAMASFELRDGKIAVWRDYWDLQTWQRQIKDAAPIAGE
ncbi:MAG: nuclear transport factor 2 family protein [Dehalococcoidia bacterium]